MYGTKGVTRALHSNARRFSTATRLQASSGLKINSERLWNTLHATCEWGAEHRYGENPTDTGMARLTLNDDDARVRRWFAAEVQKLGCSLSVDQMGNMFARQSGRLDSAAPMIAMGSHLDTQPRGGRYDGILGIMAALEILRTMKESGFQTNYDVGVVNWTNEEGARFPKSMCSSGVWAGAIPIQKAWDLRDIHDPSVTLRSELERHGYLGDIACSSDPATGYPLGAHFELHIEQGPILPGNNRSIGVVQGAQGYRWLTMTVHGKDAHTGTTPFSARQDPLLASSRMIAASHDIAKRHDALASTGIIRVPSNASTNTVSSQVTFTLDIRHPQDSVVHAVQDECLKAFEAIALQDGKGVSFDWTLDTDSPAVRFDDNCVASIQAAADQLVGREKSMLMTSGAGHDTVYTSKHCPSAMIFVPCRDGVSHHPTEYCSPQDCALGTQALLEAVVHYDQFRVEAEGQK
ncbi:Peptidase M20 [Penicillium fimorum]|uniref:Peptidase M20 n=1 Tax=Penicillium fimorum TaxID=1882269 RepID=A0A9X0C6T2_9EURO|nr:Peptidase M20 [Penicillium fimorum]